MLTKTLRITNARNAKTLSPSHMKQCIMSESRFDFLRELVKNVPDINVAEEQLAADNYPDAGESSDTSSPSLIGVDINVPGSSSGLLSHGSSVPNGNTLQLNKSGRNGTWAVRSRKELPYTTATDSELGLRSGSGSSAQQQQQQHQQQHYMQRMDWKLSKQHSLDTLQSNATRNQNFYTDRAIAPKGGAIAPKGGAIASRPDQDESTTAINYSLRDHIDGGRPPKISRIDSAPAGMANSSATNFNDYLSATTVTGTTEQPIINFDFTKGPFLPFATTANNSVSTTATNPLTTTASEILPLNIGGISVSLSIPAQSPDVTLPKQSQHHPSSHNSIDSIIRRKNSSGETQNLLTSSTLSSTSTALSTPTSLSSSIHSEVDKSAFSAQFTDGRKLSNCVLSPSVINVDLLSTPLVKINYSSPADLHSAYGPTIARKQSVSPDLLSADFFPLQQQQSLSLVHDVVPTASTHSLLSSATALRASRLSPHSGAIAAAVSKPPFSSRAQTTSAFPSVSSTVQQQPSTNSHNTTTSSSLSTSSPSPSLQQPVLNISLTNHFNNAPPSISYNIPSTTNVAPSTSALDMDEDYDNI